MTMDLLLAMYGKFVKEIDKENCQRKFTKDIAKGECQRKLPKEIVKGRWWRNLLLARTPRIQAVSNVDQCSRSLSPWPENVDPYNQNDFLWHQHRHRHRCHHYHSHPQSPLHLQRIIWNSVSLGEVKKFKRKVKHLQIHKTCSQLSPWP